MYFISYFKLFIKIFQFYLLYIYKILTYINMSKNLIKLYFAQTLSNSNNYAKGKPFNY